MYRSLPLRTARTATPSFIGRVYVLAAGIPGAGWRRSTGSLFIAIAPPRAPAACLATVAERCDDDSTASVDASLVNHRGQLVACPLFTPCCALGTKAHSVSIAAVRHRKHAIRAFTLKKPARREFFVFMDVVGRHVAQTGYLPAD
jgi:hypothetical protein